MIIHAHTQAYTVKLSKHIHTLSTSVCRLKPIKPIEISIGARIQDPRSKIAQGSSLGILDLGSWSRLKFQSVQSVSIGIQDSANRPLDICGSWIPSPIEISIGLIGFNRHTDHKHVHMIIHAHIQTCTVKLSKHIHTRSTSVCRLKPIKPIEISIGARIQDPRSKIAQGSSLGILDLGSWSRLKFQSVQSVSIGIQDSANRPLDNLGSWILDAIPIEISTCGSLR